ESLLEPTVNEPKVVNQLKVRSDAPIIEEYESDNEDEYVPQPTKEQEQPSFASTKKQVKTPRKTVKNQFTHSKNTTVDKKGLDHKVSTARHDFNRQAVLTNTTMKVNNVKPIVNRVRPANIFYKTHSPFSRSFVNTKSLRTEFSYKKVNTTEVNAVSAIGGKMETAVKPSARCNWRQKGHYWQNISKYNSGSRGCQFLGRRLIYWQCKKQTIVATSTTEAEYVAAAHCCGQVLWIQNQILDYGFNFSMNTKIYIDNESTICIVKNPVFHSKTKHC
ncbi:hypothetical protein Tco_0022579, partial [Tanacetum coccineum]